jgi:hypothetical protein
MLHFPYTLLTLLFPPRSITAELTYLWQNPSYWEEQKP